MIAINGWNNISAETKKKYLKTIPKGQSIKVEIIAPMDEEKPGLKKMPNVVSIAVKEKILDEGVNEYVEIAYVASRVLEGGVPQFGLISFEKRNNGVITLIGGNADHQNMYDFICLSDQNASKVGRNENVTPMFRVVDEEADARAANEFVQKQTEARLAVMNMSHEELRTYATTRGWGDTGPESVRQSLYRMAEADPSAILTETVVAGQEIQNEQVLNIAHQAMQKNLVVWNKENKQLQLVTGPGDAQRIDLVKANQGDKKPEVLAKYLSSDDGEVILLRIAEALGVNG